MTEEQIIAVRELRAHIQAACVDHIEHLLSQTQSALEQERRLREQVQAECGRMVSSEHICVGAAGIGDFNELCGWIDTTKEKLEQVQRERDEANRQRSTCPRSP